MSAIAYTGPPDSGTITRCCGQVMELVTFDDPDGSLTGIPCRRCRVCGLEYISTSVGEWLDATNWGTSPCPPR